MSFKWIVPLALVFTFSCCSEGANSACFDHPDKFIADLVKDAKSSVRLGATPGEVRSFCTHKRLLVVERDSVTYCTAEAHRGMSRCDASLDFHFSQDHKLTAIDMEKPRIKNP